MCRHMSVLHGHKVALVLLVGLTLACNYIYVRESTYEMHGKIVEANLIDRVVIRGRRISIIYTYSYTDSTGNTYKNSESLDDSYKPMWSMSDSSRQYVIIEYLEYDPSQSRIYRTGWRELPNLMMDFIVFFWFCVVLDILCSRRVRNTSKDKSLVSDSATSAQKENPTVSVS